MVVCRFLYFLISEKLYNNFLGFVFSGLQSACYSTHGHVKEVGRGTSFKRQFYWTYSKQCGSDSSVGIATGYVLDGPGIESGPGSVVGIATGYGLDGPGIESGPGSVVGIATCYGMDGPGIE